MLEESVVEAVGEVVEKNWSVLGRGTLRLLRERYPGVFFVAVSSSDVEGSPARMAGSVGLHFINASDHCVTVVSDIKLAGGILLDVRE